MPHTYTLIFIIIIMAGLASYVIPAGEFDRVEDEKSGSFARAITLVLEEGKIIDSLVFMAASGISHLPQTLNVVGMFFTQAFLSLFISSGSGQAAATMPIMVPISDILGLERQLAVLAFQYGDSVTNSIIPTSSALMGYLAIAGIPYERWVKFIWKLILGWTLIASLALIAAVALGIS
ncbi:AbgT family transporter [Peribacillus sp. NPDC096540]|uniref:AbgT family transporter n=1 Tax=Peribacillus sp. NPDC096540 TaxID=3390612 RepID=UPI003D08EB5F